MTLQLILNTGNYIFMITALLHKKYYGEQNYVKLKVLEHKAKLTKTTMDCKIYR